MVKSNIQKILIQILCITTVLGMWGHTLIAQPTHRIDSLEKELRKTKGFQHIDILLQLSKEYLHVSETQALTFAHKALALAGASNNQHYLSQTYFELGAIHYSISSFDSSKFYYNKALKTSISNDKTALILDNIGVLYKDKSHYDSALLYHNQSLKLKETLGDPIGVAVTYTNIGNVYFQMKKFDDALEFYSQSLTIRKERQDKPAIATVLNNIGDTYKNLTQYDKALACFTEALAIQKEIGNKATIANTLHYIGNFYFQLKIYDRAQEYYTQALDIRTQLGNKNDIAATTFNIATVHRDIGNYREALKYYDKALTLRRETGAKEAEGLILTALGGLYKNKKLYKLAIYNYELALDMYKKMGNKQLIANSYERLGIVYKDTCLYTKAEQYYSLAVQYFSQVHNMIGVARVYSYMGNIYKEKQDAGKSLQYYNRSLNLYDSLHNIAGKAHVTHNIAKLHEKFGNHTKALDAYNAALTYSKQAKELELTQEVAKALYTIYKQQKNFDRALHFYEIYTATKDTILHNRNVQRIAEIEFESNIKLLEQTNENQDLKLREEQAKRTQFTLYLIIAIIILIIILLFSILLYRQFTQKEKAFNLLSEKSTELEQAYNHLEHLNSVLKERNEKITDSLSYAKRIQKAILPQDSAIEKAFKQLFVYYLPKEIVSGDFYWFTSQQDYSFFAVVDCTGHGIPGAFMSMVGNTLLNQIVNEQHIYEPCDILQKLDTEIIKTLRQYDESTKQEDGMEISLIRINKKTNTLVFAGAGHKLIVAHNSQLETIPSSIFSIGGMHSIKQDNNVNFTQIELDITSGTTVYLFTDGFIDQFGGENDERFSTTRFMKLLGDIQSFDLCEQYIQISKTFDDWKGSTSQLDDVLVVGILFE